MSKPYIHFKLRFAVDHVSLPEYMSEEPAYFGKLAPVAIVDVTGALSFWRRASGMSVWPICGIYRKPVVRSEGGAL